MERNLYIEDSKIAARFSATCRDTSAPEPVTCDSCQLARINGIICHETGCRNSGKTWEDGAWIRYIECRECGYDVREGEVCDCQRPWEEEEVW